jgi:hypothetical protein
LNDNLPNFFRNASSEGDWALFIRTATQNPPAFLRAPLDKLLTNGDFKKKQKPVKKPQKCAKTRKKACFWASRFF